jgi:MFS family permease
VNFLTAAMQTAFGAFVIVYLVKNRWPPQDAGLALTVSTLCSLITQIPAGACIDSVRDKRYPVLGGIVGVGLAALLLCVTVTKLGVFLALAVQGLASSFIAPGIAAISLALVGQAALSERVGRNARYASIGNGLAAGVMGVAGSYLPATSAFVVAATLTLPALLSLLLIGPGVTADASWGPEAQRAKVGLTRKGVKSLLLDRRLAIFAACIVLFFAASAAIGPGLTGRVTEHRPELATLVVAVTILLPQAIVAAISPWIGRRAETSGRRPMLLLGWGLVPLQGLAFAILAGPYAFVPCYLLNAVSGAVFGVMMTVVAADLTQRTGWFNLALGMLGVAISVGASASTFLGGLALAAFGETVAASGLALAGLCGLLLMWLAMPETHPSKDAPGGRAGTGPGPER